jgi:DNA-directed RNA polymerase alpha subunit
MTSAGSDSEFGGIVSRPAQRALEGAGYATLEELIHVSEEDLLVLHSFGPKGIRMLNAELEKRGKSVGSALQEGSE